MYAFNNEMKLFSFLCMFCMTGFSISFIFNGFDSIYYVIKIAQCVILKSA